jgi:hypothetical protein
MFIHIEKQKLEEMHVTLIVIVTVSDSVIQLRENVMAQLDLQLNLNQNVIVISIKKLNQ